MKNTYRANGLNTCIITCLLSNPYRVIRILFGRLTNRVESVVFQWGLLHALTSTASLHLPHLVEGISQQVREPPVQVHGRQAAFVPFAWGDQPGQAAVRALPSAADVQLTCRRKTVCWLEISEKQADWRCKNHEMKVNMAPWCMHTSHMYVCVKAKEQKCLGTRSCRLNDKKS